MRRLNMVFLLLVCTLFTSSCWSRREIENLGFVMGIGLSKTDKGLYMAVAQVANPEAIAAEAPAQRDVYTVIKTEGLTVFDALRNLSLLAARRLYLAHIQTILIDESIAREGIGEVVGFLVQDMEIRLSSQVFITKTDPEDILDSPNILGQIPASVLEIAAKNYGANSKIYVSDLRRTVEAVNSPVMNYTTTLVEKIPSPTKYDKDRLMLTRIAFFHHDRLRGYLDYEEGQSFNLITNNFKNGLIVFEYNQTGDKITIEILKAKTKITPKYENDKVGFDIELKVQGNVAERITQRHQVHELNIKSAQEQLNQVLEDKLRKAVKNAQQKYSIDYFNLSKDFSKKYPKEFKAIKTQWNDIFSTADIHIKVESTIIHSALNINRGRI
ncbi:germination protein, Ger(x)C family [Geosporobacter subterraneus DSM 17957]|uniref:Germination protein, Ger(X)C family n=1 Tax=Geosporobacter subterraneus DSM 17957 TaxID=1121919 RepID=A0A1M6PBL1_9FIRM|nr:Ger(x)C family spore germination protein [Geosporobacter subterraneus]SHK05314.1 germination protein, Ger(x)C family [Geosporobacter subterraneus DSM 17957]